MRLARGFGVAAHTVAANGLALGAEREAPLARRSATGQGLVRSSRPPSASMRSARPRIPEPPVDARAAAPVVADLDDDFSICRRDLDPRLGCVGVLRRVGEALGDDVVDGRFDRLVETVRRDADDLDRERRAIRE